MYLLSDNASTTSQLKANAALTKDSMVGPQGDNEKTDTMVFSANLQNVEGTSQGLDGKVETKDKSNEADGEKTHAVGESFVVINLTEKEEFVPMDGIKDSAPGELKRISVIESLSKPNAMSLPPDEEMKDQNSNSTELNGNSTKSVTQHVQEQADVCQDRGLNVSMTMESSADSSKDSGVIGDLSPQSPEGSIPLEKSQNKNAESMQINAMEGIETDESTRNIPNKVGGTDDSAEASVLVQQFESVTIKNQLSPAAAKDNNQIDSMNTIDGDEHNENTESESEEGDFSSDDSSMKPDENVSESYKGNERKRKKKTGKKAYKAKRERKRGKLEMSKKGEIDNESTKAPAVEKPSGQEKQTVSDIIKPHQLTEPMQEQKQAVKINETVAQKGIVMDISLDTPGDGGGKNIDNQSVGKDMPVASGSGTNMVFGGFSVDETGKETRSDYAVRGPPTVWSSLFELDKKPTEETGVKIKPNASPVKTAGSGSSQESLQTTANEQRSGVATRSMTKDIENKQKKQTLDAGVINRGYLIFWV